MIELLFLLLPVAAAYGWIMGKNSARNQADLQSREITSQYNKGLKYLLDREEDQGLEYLINLLEVSADSVEHYLTLAAMFRRRGELDRAIKIHELLLKQPTLDNPTKELILIALAEDYVMAGMFDCAEEQLLVLVKQKNLQALEILFNIYQQTSEWKKGITLFEQYPTLFTKQQLKLGVANFYCELAIEIKQLKLIKKVISLDTHVVRPLYELGKASFIKQDYLKAISYWRDLLVQSPQYTPVFIDDLETCYEKLNLISDFNKLIENEVGRGGILIKLKYCKYLVSIEQTDKAITFLRASLEKQPNIRGFSSLLNLLAIKNVDVAPLIEEINSLVKSYIATKSEFQCKHCGFTSHTLYWSCPSCKHWESIIPSRGLDGF